MSGCGNDWLSVASERRQMPMREVQNAETRDMREVVSDEACFFLKPPILRSFRAIRMSRSALSDFWEWDLYREW